MNGGIISELLREMDGIFLQVQGVGPYRQKSAILKIPPTNYKLSKGDLVWWQSDGLHWEKRRAVRFEFEPREVLTC